MGSFDCVFLFVLFLAANVNIYRVGTIINQGCLNANFRDNLRIFCVCQIPRLTKLSDKIGMPCFDVLTRLFNFFYYADNFKKIRNVNVGEVEKFNILNSYLLKYTFPQLLFHMTQLLKYLDI